MRFRSRGLGIALFAAGFALCARAQNAEPAPRHITLSEAVQLALKQNHVVRIAGLQVQEKTACEGGRPEWILPERNE
jgi:hypothetical protein